MTLTEFNLYKLGISEIDDDHRKMFMSIDQILNEVLSNNYSNVNSSLEKLMFVCTNHMQNEVELMSIMNFPFMDTHITEHSILTHMLAREIDNARHGDYTNLSVGIEKILINHIIQYDGLYADYARAMQCLSATQQENR